MSASPSAIDLYWIPLGAGARFVRLNGQAFEAMTELVERRRRCDLYHSALQVTTPRLPVRHRADAGSEPRRS